jgi:hypothetical protein
VKTIEQGWIFNINLWRVDFYAYFLSGGGERKIFSAPNHLDAKA